MKTAGRPGLPALALLASMIVSFLASAAAPTPLYASHAGAWLFSSLTTTIVFGTYTVAVPAALLVLGRTSDHLGRKPVLLTALARCRSSPWSSSAKPARCRRLARRAGAAPQPVSEPASDVADGVAACPDSAAR
ncbi:hypothetical protein [Streptomyces sp. SRF1]|uniref:hypothetical protein n=1 Tax=Streptomyces sp. SRF1 TaxID=1549642 RepID=UPI0025AFFF87|nr:hypothetical protein [Streptomyces sp. SRF1]